jgi:type III secretion system FlhB-like substrate exporter
MYPTTGYNSLPSTAPRAVSTGIPTVTKTLVKTAVKTVKVTETAAAVTKFVGSSIHSIVPADLFKNATIAYKAVHKHVGPGELSLIHWGLGLAIAAGAGVGAGMIPERHLQRQRPRPPPGMGEIRWRRIAQRAVIGLKQLLAHNRVLMKELEDVKSNVQGLIPSLKLTTEELGRSIVKIKELHEALAVSRAEAADIRQELQRARDASRELEMRLKEKSAHCDEVQRQIEQLESGKSLTPYFSRYVLTNSPQKPRRP